MHVLLLDTEWNCESFRNVFDTRLGGTLHVYISFKGRDKRILGLSRFRQFLYHRPLYNPHSKKEIIWPWQIYWQCIFIFSFTNEWLRICFTIILKFYNSSIKRTMLLGNNPGVWVTGCEFWRFGCVMFCLWCMGCRVPVPSLSLCAGVGITPMIAFRRWDEILSQRFPKDQNVMPYTYATLLYARAVAWS